MVRPNIVLILADDLGFSDLGCYGGEIPTPNLDALARTGIRHSQFYNTARCSPSRASLLTGLHPHQTGIGVLTRPDLPDGYAGNFADGCATIAETLKQSGWTTWMSGKWHLSANKTVPNSSWPTRRGFDRYFGTLAGCCSFYDPQTLMRGEERADDAAENPGFYYTDAISDEAVSWIDEHHSGGDAEQPFFLYLAYTAPHWPLHAPPEDIAAFDGHYDAGWDELRTARLERMIAEGIMEPGSSLSERDPSQPSWGDVLEPEWQAKRMQTYAAQVARMDGGIGRVVDALRRAGALDNTVVIFLSDNGASAEELPLGELTSFTHKDLVMRTGTRDGRPVRIGNEPAIVPGPEDTYSSYGVPWANLSNTPLRRYKRWVHEGGISAPFIVTWPMGELTEGAVVSTAFQLVDVVPTLLAAAGIDEEAHFGTNGSEIEGRSMLQAWQGAAMEPTYLYWEHIGNAAIRHGRWKLVREFPDEWELYDIETDRIESVDLAHKHPDVVAELTENWRRWADRVGVIPWDQMVDAYTQRGLSPADAEE